ncbi:uncharacterized protein LOC130449436 [Diorhabda sublineata]|uniref:uncharacterized protein LOC130449436 n=1 Tax=Diorhabda sublineata TaxID=1163346 RepID=UPI0024E0C15F|nr:uncharacterized protein LOC130449436 [Diorhabda sublineata]
MGNLVHLLLLLLLVYGEFTMSITEKSEDNQQMALDIDQNDTNIPDVDNATNLNGTVAPSGNIRLNKTFIVSTNTSNKPDRIHIVLISENNEPIDEFIANSFLNLKLGNDIPHGNLYKSYRPWYAGLGTTRPPRIKPGKPWPARPEDYANFSVATNGNVKVEDRYEESSTESVETAQTSSDDPNSIIPTPKSDRPSFAGLGTTRPPRIKPGKPWPARPEDYANFSVTTNGNVKVEDRYEESSTESVETAQTSSDNLDSIIPTPKSDRPSFAGLGTTRPPRIKPGKPWPARPEDYANFSVTTNGNVKVEDRYEESSTEAVETAQTSSDDPNSIIPTPKSDRPSFAGLGTTRPPRIKPGKPWPARPEDYANFSVTTNGNVKVEDRYEESSTEAVETAQTSSDDPNSIIPTPKSDRPSFAGLGTTRPPRIKPGKPWPARPEDYANFSVATNGNVKVEDIYEESLTESVETAQTSSDNPNSIIPTPKSDRPSFAGLGTTRPPRIKPGKPWPARPEDYANFSVTTNGNVKVEDRYEESYSGAVESIKKEYFEDKTDETTTKILRNSNFNAVIHKEFKNDNK